MRKYRQGAASLERVIYGVDLVAGLRGFAETRALAGAFEALNQQLYDAFALRLARTLPLNEARARLRLADFTTDMVIRTFARAVEIADHGRKGPLYEHVFPDGLTPVVAPTGRRQLAPTQGLIEHLVKSRHERIDPVRAEWVPRLEAAVAEMQEAMGLHAAATEAHQEAFRHELRLRAAHELAVDRLMGEVRAAFPKDRAWQDVVFPPVEKTRRAVRGDELEDDAGEPDEQDAEVPAAE